MVRPHRLGSAFALPLVLMTVGAGGCMGSSDQPIDTIPRVAVSGNVTFDGKPPPAGKIQFQPLASGPAVMAVGDIRDGQFAIDRPNGPPPGKYRVMISSRAATTFEENENPGSVRLDPERIPKQYNLQSNLKVEVKPEGPLSFEFPLVKNP